MEYCIVGKNIEKLYGAKKVLDNVDIHVPMNSIYGLIAPNGAGKSTLLKCIMNLIHIDGGNIKVFDNTSGMGKHELNRTGSLIEYPYFYDDLTGMENLLIHSKYMGYYDKKRIDEVLDEVDLTKDAEKKTANYSMGMRQRLGIALALLNRPKLLILDEPTNGLDPLGIQELRELIRSFSEQGITVILSSHILNEVELIADHIGIMAGGRLGYSGEIDHEEDLEALFMRVVQECRGKEAV